MDAVRRERFQDLILYPQPLSLTQIALMLGYSEQAALTRNCRLRLLRQHDTLCGQGL